MLDEESVKTYRSIHLSRDLQPDILARHAEKQTQRPKFFSVKVLRPLCAVCSLALITAILIATSMQSGTGLFTADMRLASSPQSIEVQTVTYTDTRVRAYSAEPVAADILSAGDCVPLTVKLNKDVFIQISAGALLLPDESGSLIYAESFGEIKSGETFYWSLTGCEALSPLTAQLTDADNAPVGTITLTYVNTDNTWMISGDLSEN